MIQVIDLLASSYHWSKREILEDVYPDEVPELTRLIDERWRSNKLMDLAIAHNPYSESAQDLWDELKPLDTSHLDAGFDREGFEALKKQLAGNPKFKVE